MARSAAFWSYAHEDARRDGEALLRLAHRLSDEFALLTGDELVIFIDRDAIEWGEEWRRRIDGALAETTFFIPIVTPRYFTREECRRELLTFAGRAESLGVRELVLPILYVDVPDLDDSSKDEAVALVARMQYVDWRDLRLQDHGSEDYRRAINALASRLSSVASTIDDRERGREVARAEGDSELGTTDSLDELLAELTRLLPEWLASVEDDPIVEVEHKAVDAAYEERLARLRAARAPHSAVLSTQIRHARDLLPLAQRHLTFAETYAARTVELDPTVHSVLRLVEEYPENLPALEEITAGVAAAMEIIRRSEEEEGRLGLFAAAARRVQHVSRLWRDVAETHERADALVEEANNLVKAWSERLTSLGASGSNNGEESEQESV